VRTHPEKIYTNLGPLVLRLRHDGLPEPIMTVALPSGSAIGQSAMVALPSGRAIGQSGVSQDRLVGTWTYESIVIERTDGTKVAPFGRDPKGFITLSPAGRYSLQIIRPDIPKIASKDRLSATAEENRAVAQGVLSQFGTYSSCAGAGRSRRNACDQVRVKCSSPSLSIELTNLSPGLSQICFSFG
jgi:hypothetical protein